MAKRTLGIGSSPLTFLMDSLAGYSFLKWDQRKTALSDLFSFRFGEQASGDKPWLGLNLASRISSGRVRCVNLKAGKSLLGD